MRISYCKASITNSEKTDEISVYLAPTSVSYVDVTKTEQNILSESKISDFSILLYTFSRIFT